MKNAIFFIFIIITLVSCSSSKEDKINNQSDSDKNDDSIVASSFYQEKFIKGIDFFARGNEPNWILEMDSESNFTFKPMYDSTLIIPAVEGIKDDTADVTRFHSQYKNGELSITLIKFPCEDNMSGEKFDYKVSIELKSTNNKIYQTYNGCGKYLYDNRLNHIWKMESISALDLTKEELMKGIPTFEFNLKNMRFGGHAGCNNLSSKIELKGNEIKFGNIAATMMACPEMKVERKVVDAINMKSFNYKIEDSSLTLENKSIKMTFKKVN